jgi:hypothetical protein
MALDFPQIGSSGREKYLIPDEHVFRFRVVLDHVEPAIWRVFDLPANLRLATLSDTILAAMGWKNSHLHQFKIAEVRISPRFEDDDPFRIIDEADVFTAAIFHKRGDTCAYQYDFGDWWEHTIQMLDFFPREKGTKYPALIDGARACPPEDFGGPHAYNEFLASGKTLPRFEPEAFNFVTARNRVKKVPLRPFRGYRNFRP